MHNNNNMAIYAATAGIFLLLKMGYMFADNIDLAFLLLPTDRFMVLLTGSGASFSAADGYYHEALAIRIDKSCSGFNFWILCFAMLAFLAVNHLHRTRDKMLALPLALLVAYGLTILANVSRIMVSLVIHQSGGQFMPRDWSWLHQAEGTFIYLFFLITIYTGAEHLLQLATRDYAKPA